MKHRSASQPELTNTLRIAITLPYLYMVRDFLFTPVWDEMGKRNNVHFYLLCGDAEARQLSIERDYGNISLVQFPVASNDRKYLRKRLRSRDSPQTIRSLAFRLLDDRYLLDSVIYRFGAVNNLSNCEIRKRRSQLVKRLQPAGWSYPKGESAGFPFPKSKSMFRLLYSLRQSFLNAPRVEDTAILQSLQPDLAVLGGVQLPGAVYWIKAFHRLRVPVIGIVPSWDHPTTKGPMPRGISGYVVASKRMVDEMSSLQGIDRERIYQIGKVQMDHYTNRYIFAPREDFLEKLGIPADHHLITFGTNNIGVKEHEISIAARLSLDFAEGRFGKATLIIRTHPQDTDWERDFLALANPPWVLCQSASSFGCCSGGDPINGLDDQIMLASLMKHSDVVIQSRGSLALDAVAFDTPVISLGFDGDLQRSPNDSFLLEYEHEHYKPIVAAKGTWLVGSYEELNLAISRYLADPTTHMEGRRIIRNDHIEPLDGKASQRLVDYMVESATRAREGTLPGADWRRSGLGDVTWASRQVCSVHDYVRDEGPCLVSFRQGVLQVM